jgi:hypothetical protein
MTRQLTLTEEIKTNGSSYDFDALRKIEVLENKADKEYVKEILKSLKETFTEYNIKYIIGQFSGGNDSGGFDDVYFADNEENEIVIKEENKINFKFFVDKKNIYQFENEKEKKISVFSTNTHKEDNLVDNLEDILYKTGCLEEYGSFAGEFNVNGTVKLNVLTCKWNRNGQETVESYESNNDEGEL